MAGGAGGHLHDIVHLHFYTEVGRLQWAASECFHEIGEAMPPTYHWGLFHCPPLDPPLLQIKAYLIYKPGV